MATRPGATSAPRIYSRAITCATPLGGELHTENGCRHGKYLKMRRYPRGSVALSSSGFCTVIRGAFCIVPVQASGIFGQVPLSPAPVIPSCVYHAARAGALIHLQLRTRLSSALELSRSRLLTHPLATQSIYLSLIFTSSLSLPFSTHAHA